MVIGIVGGVASGKSYVAQRLESHGANRIDADRLGHEVLTDPAVTSALTARWGDRVVDATGEIDRTAVAEIVFALPPRGPQELDFLERMTHTRISARIEQKIEQWAQEHEPAIVLDAAVLLKAGWDRFCDRILFVDVPHQLRLARALARGWKRSDFAARENAQESLQAKRTCADLVIDNSGTPEQTDAQIRDFWQTLDISSTPDQ
jgi:dephospho-CoA kinase